jgi:hypothetical protein
MVVDLELVVQIINKQSGRPREEKARRELICFVFTPWTPQSHSSILEGEKDVARK